VSQPASDRLPQSGDLAILEEKLARRRVRYVARARSLFHRPVYLLRMEQPSGTLLVSLDKVFPAVALLPEGESPPGEKSADASRLEEALAARSPERFRVDPVDRSIVIDWEGGPLMRVDLIPARPALHLSGEGRPPLTLPRERDAALGTETEPPELPSRGKPDLLHFDPAELEGCTIADAREKIRGAVRSIPPEWIDEVIHRAAGEESGERDRTIRLGPAWREMIEELRGPGIAPALYRRNEAIVLSPIPLRHSTPERTFPDLAAGVAAYWKARSDELERDALVRRTVAEARAEKKRSARLIARLEADRREAEEAPRLRRQAEILSAYFRSIPRGAHSVRLDDPYDGKTIEIALDPKRTPKENVDRYFRLATRKARSLPRIEERLAEARAKKDLLEETEREGARVKTREEAAALAERAANLFKPKPKEPDWKKRIKRPMDRKEKARPREYRVAGRYTVLVGRDNKENDYLTFKIAGQRDLWFHASQSPGSHAVLLKNDPKENPPKEALLEAAAIAAYHSKARHGGKVPVIYTERRFVRKPRGAPPGQVTCAREKTLFVDPGLPENGPGDSSTARG
jgi:hypothetical protein